MKILTGSAKAFEAAIGESALLTRFALFSPRRYTSLDSQPAIMTRIYSLSNE